MQFTAAIIFLLNTIQNQLSVLNAALGRVKPVQLVPEGRLDVVLVNGGVDVALTQKEVQGVVHFNL